MLAPHNGQIIQTEKAVKVMKLVLTYPGPFVTIFYSVIVSDPHTQRMNCFI